MLSDRIIPFERNKYFYGKLLTAADFETEQSYFNNKRRLVNRLLFGTGVVSGLNVIKADDLNIVIEAGLALDYGGREIVIPEPLVKTLSSLEGFKESLGVLGKNEEESIHSVYLCVRYHENPSQPVHSIAKSALSDENEGSEYSKTQENFALFLTVGEPKNYPGGMAQNVITLWSKNGIEITLLTPKYVKSGESFYIKTRLKKGANNQTVSFEFNAELSFITHENEHSVIIGFNEPDIDAKEHYTVNTVLTSSYPQNGVIRITDLKVKIGDVQHEAEMQTQCEINISDNPEQALLDSMRLMPLEETLGAIQNIYLAKIYLILTGEYYIIEKVEPLPFEQTVLTVPQANALRLIKNCFSPQLSLTDNRLAYSEQEDTQGEALTRSGTLEVIIPEKSVKNGCYYSKPTPHFLGTGMVTITAGLLHGDEVLFGDITPFDTSLVWGVSLNKAQGLFTIAVKLFRPIPPCKLCFNWTAVRQTEPPVNKKSDISLVPSISYIAPNQTVIFEITKDGERVKPEEFVWSVNTPIAGRVSKNGVYSASGTSGFYEVSAKSAVVPNQSASAFIIISEDNESKGGLL